MRPRTTIPTAIVILAALGGFFFWYQVLRNDAPPAATLPSVASSAGSATTSISGSPDGAWVVQRGADVFAGYRIKELFGGDTIKKTAVGRSPAVDGTMTVNGTTVSDIALTVDMTALASDSSRRDNRMRTDGLQTDTFPTATFALTSPIELPSAPTGGTEQSAPATGDLTLHGVTKTVTVTVKARWNGDTIDVAASAPITLADFSITPPRIGGFVTVDGEGTLEVQLRFVRSTDAPPGAGGATTAG